MAETKTEVTFDSEEVQKLLNDITSRYQKIEEKDKVVVDLLSLIVFRDVIKHFELESGPDGKWPEWSNSYRKKMANIGKLSNKKLQDTGRLRQSFTEKEYRIESDAIVWFNPAKTSKGFPYAYAHDTGGPILPQREFMWLSNSALKEFESQIIKYLES